MRERPRRRPRRLFLSVLQSAETEKKKEAEVKLPFKALFRFATPLDKLLMFIGALGAVANGAALPAFAVIFGEMLNAINPDQTNQVRPLPILLRLRA